MNKNSLLMMLSVVVTFMLTLSCGESNDSTKNIIKSIQPSISSPVKQGENINFLFTTTSKIDSAQLYISDRYIATTHQQGFAYPISSSSRIGERDYKIVVYRKGTVHERKGKFLILPSTEPNKKDATKIATLPHSRTSYTQGLEFYKGRLYESSGEYGSSYLRIMEFPSMRELKRINLDKNYFAEGITVINDKLYMLTWKERKAFVYNPETLEQIGEFAYEGEGWGLTNDGEHIYMSDGTQYIYKLNPETFERLSRVEVLTPSGAITYINELEWVDGKILANVYGYESILVIDPESGLVEDILFCNGMLDASMRNETTDVFNGIARDPANAKIYVTGKNWPEMYQIKF